MSDVPLRRRYLQATQELLVRELCPNKRVQNRGRQRMFVCLSARASGRSALTHISVS